MLVKIRGIQSDIDITSVILEHNKKEADLSNLILWHCPICNQPLFQYTSKLLMIVPGLTPIDSPPIIVHCAKCGRRYLISSISSAKI